MGDGSCSGGLLSYSGTPARSCLLPRSGTVRSMAVAEVTNLHPQGRSLPRIGKVNSGVSTHIRAAIPASRQLDTMSGALRKLEAVTQHMLVEIDALQGEIASVQVE
jgi:hypothetical protein